MKTLNTAFTVITLEPCHSCMSLNAYKNISETACNHTSVR